MDRTEPVPPEPVPPEPAEVDDGARRDALAEILRGRWIETERGPTFLKSSLVEADRSHGQVPLAAILRGGADVVEILGGGRTEPERLCFLDTETTGLAGGTGTYAFLVCLGSFEDGAFSIRQYFLTEPSTEEAMLSLLREDLARFDGYVSYNGRAFDLPLLQTRLTLARIEDPTSGRPHLDLLHAVRRLWRHRLPGCRLLDAEIHLLGFDRGDDVPGHLIPSLYFDYLRAERIAPLRAVFRHNALDVLSTAALLGHAAELFARDPPSPREAVAIGRWWDLEGQPARAEAYYRLAVAELPSETAANGEWILAARRYAMLRKRAGARREVIEVWSRLWMEGDREAAVEIAKYLEHEARDLVAAERIVRDLLEKATDLDRAEVEHRLARIVRRIAAGGGPG
jgi:hypothetical protein